MKTAVKKPDTETLKPKPWKTPRTSRRDRFPLSRSDAGQFLFHRIQGLTVFHERIHAGDGAIRPWRFLLNDCVTRAWVIPARRAMSASFRTLPVSICRHNSMALRIYCCRSSIGVSSGANSMPSIFPRRWCISRILISSSLKRFASRQGNRE